MRPATLIVSGDEFLASEALGELRTEATEAGYSREEIPAGEAQALAYALGTGSLFDAGRLIVVRDAQDLPAEAAQTVVRWIAGPTPGIVLALVAVPGAKATRLVKALGDGIDRVTPAAPAPWETAGWIAARIRRRGRKVSGEAAQALVDALGTDLRELAAAADQLLDETEGAIDVARVAARFQGLESKVYEFVDAVLDRDRVAALKRLHSLAEQGENPIGIVAALARQMRLVAAVKDSEPRAAEAIAREFGGRPGQVKRAFRQARNFSADEIRRAYRLLADGDLALKSEEKDELVLDLLVDEITERGPR